MLQKETDLNQLKSDTIFTKLLLEVPVRLKVNSLIVRTLDYFL